MSLLELTSILREYGHKKPDPTRVRHILMTAYGWIPEKEFYEESSIAEVAKLLEFIKRDSEHMEAQMRKR